jgi:cobalt/nickel transport system permease protein
LEAKKILATGDHAMHLGNGAITPECAAIAFGAAAAGLATSAASLRRSGVTRDKLLLAGVMGTLVFAAQAINVPVASGISAHLVGGVLLAAVLGPALAAWTMAIVLAVQALALGDGGLAALGANVLNMAFVPAGIVAVMNRLVAAKTGLLPLGAAAALSVVLAAGLIALQTAAFRPLAELEGWSRFAAAMLATHLWIGVLEAMLTGAILAALAGRLSPAANQSMSQPRLAFVVVAVLLAAVLAPLSSALPDGYEAAAESSGMAWLLME